jgi:hypothetical protein
MKIGSSVAPIFFALFRNGARDHFVVDVAGVGAGGLKWLWETRPAGDESRIN